MNYYNWEVDDASQHLPGSGEFNPSRAIKTIRVRVFVWTHSTNTSFTIAEEQRIRDILARVEQEHWIDIQAPTDPSAYYLNNRPCPDDPTLNWYQCHSDARLRMDLRGVHFVDDDVLSTVDCQGGGRLQLNTAAHALVPNSERDLKIHITTGGCAGQGAAYTPRWQGSLHQDEISGVTTKFFFEGNQELMDNFYVRHWAHELGHCLGLKHTYIGSVADVGAFEYCGGNQNVRYLADIFGKYVLDGGETGTLDIPRTSGCSLPGAEPDCPIVSMNPQCGTPSADPWDCCINN